MKFIAVAETAVVYRISGDSFTLHWQKQPLAIVVQSPDTVQAFSIDGCPLSLEELQAQYNIPDLEGID